ncbi:biotin-independent malonate decarboxylase subunit gamma [Paraburkholderia bryophila]|uniref:biotin-independent malonate decarboxylase subunit gamma n=1 Tax=Burkholderiaceae TaxID=119060 RepID=UPI0005511B16|nr:biotin-independent malonate decarboxylase subunit gamma [Burkholderia sp. 9120]
MTLDNILTSLFVDPGEIKFNGNRLAGTARVQGGPLLHVLGFTNRAPLGVDEAIELAAQVLDIVDAADTADTAPILVLIDSSSQRMSRRDELLGLSEYLAHLAKCLLLAESAGHRTIGLLYGGSAAGAFIATALACGTLVALPGAHPEVMDLPSMARVTKLPLDVLKEKAGTTPVFAPGLDNLVKTGGIAQVWDATQPLAGQLVALLDSTATPRNDDPRASLGLARGGRGKAARIAERVRDEVRRHA